MKGSSGKYCFMQDDNCHWYMIKVSEKNLFIQMLDRGFMDEYEQFDKQFGRKLMAMHPSNYCFDNVEEIA